MAMLQVLRPLTLVSLVLSKPVHSTIAAFLVVLPLALVCVTGRVFHSALAVAEVLAELALI